jgi:hypothetical protein
MKEGTTDSLRASTIRARATFESAVPTKLEAEMSGPARHLGAICKDDHKCHRHVASGKKKWLEI